MHILVVRHSRQLLGLHAYRTAPYQIVPHAFYHSYGLYQISQIKVPSTTENSSSSRKKRRNKTHMAAVLDKLELREHARPTSDHPVNLDQSMQMHLSKRSTWARGGRGGVSPCAAKQQAR